MGFLVVSRLIKQLTRCFCEIPTSEIMSYLNVAEKNDAAKTISSFLSRGGSTRREGFSPYNKIYEFQATLFNQQTRMVMTSVSGHLLNYEFVAQFKSWQTCSPLALFDAPIYKNCSEDYQRIKRTLEREIRSCNGLIIWTDCDREGENIGFEIIDVCKNIKPQIRIYRAKFSEITAASVFRALNNLIQPNKNVSDAVDVRQEIDLRTGAAFTRLQTLRFQKVFPNKLSDKLVSYGSCQFPTLGFVVERYQAIEEFIPEPFWRIKLSHLLKDLNVEFYWKRNRLFDKRACEAILDICLEANLAKVESVESKPKSKWRPLPLDTIELEKTVSRKLRINAKDTMKIAEKLYTQGLISYPRTETNIFPKELDLRPLVEQQGGDQRWGAFAQRILEEGGPNPRQGRKSDQAHPPIHPLKYSNELNGNEKSVYEYIVRHFLACVSKDALGHETTVLVDVANEKFTAKGLMILERNYLDVYIYEKWNAKEIHCYRQGDTFTPTDLSLAESVTTPPKLLTEADLIGLMEKHGIGTDATHAEHIDKIKSREYVGLHENIYFVPGTLGMGLVEGYNNIGLEVSLAKPSLRAEFENDLKLICEGRKDAEVVRRDQVAKYKAVFRTVTEKIAEIDRILGVRLNDRPQEIQEEIIQVEEYKEALKCPKCDKGMVLRSRKNGPGKFLSCLGYPGCRNAVWFPSCTDTVEILDQHCDICGPNVKKMRIKFKQNPFPGEPNPNTLCIGGCDQNVLETLAINSSSVRKLPARNATVQEVENVPVIPNLNTLNNWLVNNGETRATTTTTTRTNTQTRPNTQNRNTTNTTNRNETSNPIRRNYSTNQAPASRSFLNPTSGMMAPPSTARNQPNLPNGSQSNRRNGGNETATNWANSSVWDASFGNMENQETLCSCNQEAILLTVRKEGPNTGRKFYKCANGIQGGGCNFFMWATDENTNTNRTRPPPGRPGGTNLKCNCNLPPNERVVNKEGPNKGRRFFCCSKPMGEGCDFFKWADDPGGAGGGGDDGDNGGGGGGGDDGAPWGGSNWLPPNDNRWGATTTKRKWKGKAKSKKKTNVPYKNKPKAKRKCSKCGEEGHIKTHCPNSSG